MTEFLDYLNRSPAVVAAMLTISSTIIIVPSINYLAGRQNRLLKQNLDLRKSLFAGMESSKLDQVIQYQLNKYSRTQYGKHKYQHKYYWIIIVLRIIAYCVLSLSIESFNQNFVLSGWILLIAVIFIFVIEIIAGIKVYHGILPKTYFIASLLDGTHEGINLKLQEQILNSGKGRIIGSPWVFIYNYETLIIDSYKKLKIDPSRFHKRFLREKLRVVQYEYSHSIAADGAYKELSDYPVIDSRSLVFRNVNLG